MRQVLLLISVKNSNFFTSPQTLLVKKEIKNKKSGKNMNLKIFLHPKIQIKSEDKGSNQDKKIAEINFARLFFKIEIYIIFFYLQLKIFNFWLPFFNLC